MRYTNRRLLDFTSNQQFKAVFPNKQQNMHSRCALLSKRFGTMLQPTAVHP